MQILDKNVYSGMEVTGRLSDGSDREVIPVTIVTIKIDDGTGLKILVFDHDPTDIEMQEALSAGHFTDVTDDVYQLKKRVELTEQALDELILEGVL